MVSFAQPLFWQIKYIVTALTKKNWKSSLNELHNLIAAYGYDAQVFFLRVLLEDAASTNWQSSGRGSLQLQALSQELKEIEHEEQFGQLLCHAIEQFKENFSEDFLSQLCKATKICLPTQMNMAVAMLQSLPLSQEMSRRESAKFLRNRFREFLSNRQVRLSEPLVHSLLALLKGCPSSEVQEVMEEKERDQFFKQLLDHHPEIDTTKGPLAGLLVLYKMRESRLKQHARRVSEVPILASGYQEGVRACDLVEELGHHGGSSSVQAIRETLDLEFPHLDKRGVAEIIAVALHFTSDGPKVEKVDPHAGLVAHLATATARYKEGVNQWNSPELTQQIWQPQTTPPTEALSVDLIIDIVKSAVGVKKEWEEVFSLMFDLPELRLPNKKSVEALVAAFKYAQPKAEFPLEAVLRLRRNTTAQLQFIKYAVHGLSVTLNWFEHKSLEPIMGLPGAEGGPNTAGPGNCWTCLKLLEVLFELAEMEDYTVVQKLFSMGYGLRPHAMLVSCCLAEDRSRGTMRADILEKLAPPLFEPNGGPNALLATVALAQRQPKGLKKLLRAMLDKDPHHNLQKILNLLMNENLKTFYADLLKEPPSELVCRIVLASQTLPNKENVVNLCDWLGKVLAEHKDRAAESLVHFLRSRFMSETGQPLTTFRQPPPLPSSLDEADICQTFLLVLNQAPELSQETTRQVRELEILAQQRHPQLAPTFAPPANRPPPPEPTPPASAQISPPPSSPPPAPSQPVPAPPSQPVPPPAPVPAQVPPRAEPQRNGDTPAKLEEEAHSIIKSLFDRVRTPQELNKLLQEYSKQEDKHHYKQVYNKTIETICQDMETFHTLPAEANYLATQMISFLLDSGCFGSYEGQVLRHITEHLKNPVAASDVNFQLTIVNTLLDRLAKWPLLCSEISRMQEMSDKLPPLKSYVEYTSKIVNLINPESRKLSSLPQAQLLRIQYHIPHAPSKEAIQTYDTVKENWVPGTLYEYVHPRDERRTEAKAAMARQNPPPMPPPPKAMNQGPPRDQRPLTVDQLLAEPEIPINAPSQSVQDAVAAVFNSLSVDNIPEKVDQLQRHVKPEDYQWLCYYTVSRRASREANFHHQFIAFFSQCRDKKTLFHRLINMTFECLRLMMKAVDEAVHSSSHRTALKSLGTWLGLITVGRDYPLKSKSMDIKDLLLDAYENQRLTAVLPMACKILEAVEKSRVFKLPSPWTTGLLSLVAEIHGVPDLRTNLSFEVEVLFRHLQIDVNTWPKSDLLRTRRAPVGGPDLGGKHRPQEMPQDLAPPQRPQQAYWQQGEHGQREMEYRAYVQQQQTYQLREQDRHARAMPQHAVPQAAAQQHDENHITPMLQSLVQVPPEFQIFRSRPRLLRWLTTAVDAAVREVLQAVEPSIKIACFSSAQMALKDFLYEVDHELLQKAATYMAVAVSGSLALVMCRDPLEKSLKSQLMYIFMQQVNAKDLTLRDADTMEKFINVLAERNMDACSILVEKYVSDTAVIEVERVLTPNLEGRMEHKTRFPHNMFFDDKVSQNHWLQHIPENLRQCPGSLSPMFLKIYKDFYNHYSGYIQRLPRGLEAERLNFQSERERYPYHQQHQPRPPIADQHCFNFQRQKELRYQQQQQYAIRGRRPEEMAMATATLPQQAPQSQQERDRNMAENKQQAGQIMQKMQSHIASLQEQPLRLSSLMNINLPLHCTDDTLEAVAALWNIDKDHDLRKTLRGVRRWAMNLQNMPGSEDTFSNMVKQVFKMLSTQFHKPEMMQTPPDCVSVLHVVTEVLLCTLDYLGTTPPFKKLLSDTLVTRLDDMESNGYLQLDVVAGILRYRLVQVAEIDRMMSRWMDGRRPGPGGQTQVNVPAADFVILVLQRCCLEHRTHFGKDFQKCGEIITKQAERRRRLNQQQQQAMSSQELQLLTQADIFVEKLNAQTSQGEEDYMPLANRQPRLMVTAVWQQKETEDNKQKAQFDADTVSKQLHEWHSLVQADGQHPPSLDHMGHTQNRQVGGLLQKIIGMLFSPNHSSEETVELFFRYGVEYTVKYAQQKLEEAEQAPGHKGPSDFGFVDSFSYLVVSLLKKPSEALGRFIDWPINLTTQAVGILKCALQAIHKALAATAKAQETRFNQRVWHRILMNILLDTAHCPTPEASRPTDLSQQYNWKILQLISETFLALNPMRVPAFCFSWLDLISHKQFMTRILNIPQRRGWLLFQRIFMGLLNFIGPYLARIRMSDVIRNLYKCTLRTLLALLYDFPEFLSEYHMIFCDVIPWQCVQIRNLILAAFPSSMKLPDPFTHSLKVDTLPEMKVSPTIQSTYLLKLMICGLKADVDNWIRTGDRGLLENIIKKLMYSDPMVALEAGTKYNVPLLNATILYAGANCLFMQSKDERSPSLVFFEYLLEHFDTEGRFWMFTTFANHLRFPNMHTYCFSCIILWLFSNTRIQEVREQITRVLLERLIVHRPHPWGLLITFIELIKNGRYQFWGFDFVKSDQQLQKLFTSVAFTCLGQPIPTEGEPVDTPEAQLNYLKAYKFNEVAHQHFRQQQIDAQQAALRAQAHHHAQQAAAQQVVLQQAAQAGLAQQPVPQQAPPPQGPPAQAPPAAPPAQAPPPAPLPRPQEAVLPQANAPKAKAVPQVPENALRAGPKGLPPTAMPPP